MLVAIKHAGLFQAWSYSVGHGRLLFRRTKPEPGATQIDILFKDVSAMMLASRFENIEINELRAGDPRLPAQLVAIGDADSKAYQIIGNNFEGFVIAAAVFIDESDREYWETSPLLDG
jgi:hypothetical protein